MDINMPTLSPGTNTILSTGTGYTFDVPAGSTHYYSIDMYGGGGSGGNSLQLTGNTPADNYLKKSGGGGAAGQHFTTSSIVPIANTGQTPLQVTVDFTVGAKGIASAAVGNQGTDGLSSTVTVTPFGGTPLTYTALGGNAGKGAYTGGYTAVAPGGTGIGGAGGAGGIDTILVIGPPVGNQTNAVSGTGTSSANAFGYGGGGGGGLGGGDGGIVGSSPNGSNGTLPGAGGGGGAYDPLTLGVGIGGNGVEGLITFTLVDNLPNIPTIVSTISTSASTLDVVFQSNLANAAGAPPTSYNVTLTGGGQPPITQSVLLSAGIPTTPPSVNNEFTVQFTGLTAGVFYDVVVTAVSAAGNTSTVPTSAVGFDAGIPSGPITPTTIIGVITGTTSLTVFFDPVPSLQYSVNLYIPGTIGVVAPIITTTPIIPLTGAIIITPVNPSTEYSVELTTYSNDLVSFASNVDTTNYTTLDSEEVTNMTATPGDASISVSFDQSISQPVSDYSINVYDTTVANYFSIAPVYQHTVVYIPNVSSYNITLDSTTGYSFVNGIEYMVIVTNDSSNGSTPPVFVIPNGPPTTTITSFGIPTVISPNPVSSVYNQLELVFPASVTPENLLIDYTVELTNTTNNTVTTVTIPITPATTVYTYLFNGLITGDQYSVTVTPNPNPSWTTNTSPSPASTSSPTGVLLPVTNLTAICAVNTPSNPTTPYNITVNFTPSLSSNASFPNYLIQVIEGSTIVASQTISSTSTSTLLPVLINSPNLNAGNTYTVTVTTTDINNANYTPDIIPGVATSAPVLFYGPISPPVILAPNFNNGSSQVQINLGLSSDQNAFLANSTGLTYTVTTTNPSDPNPHTLTFTANQASTIYYAQIQNGLINGLIYTITAVANIPVNSSPSPSNPFTGPSAPVTSTFYMNYVEITNTTGNSATVSFPAGNTIFPPTTPPPTISAYTIKIYKQAGAPGPTGDILVNTYTGLPPYNGTLFSQTFTGLDFNIQYYATVETTPTTQIIQSQNFSLTALAPPTVTVTAVEGTASVTYTDPNGSGVTYALQIITSASLSNVTVSQPQNNTFTVFGLEPSTTYNFIVTASLLDLNGVDLLTPVPSSSVPFTTSDFLVFIDIQGDAICYVKGTYISTARGWIPIEKLTVNDSLKTYDLIKTTTHTNIHGVNIKNKTRVKNPNTKSMFAPVKFVGTFAVNKMNEFTAPIRIKAGAFAPNKPERDLLVSPNHGIFMGDKLVYAKLLVNGTTIYQDVSLNSVEYYHVLSDNHYIINANGILSESLGSEELKFFLSLDAYSKKIPTPPIHNDLDLLVF